MNNKIREAVSKGVTVAKKLAEDYHDGLAMWDVLVLCKIVGGDDFEVIFGEERGNDGQDVSV